MRSRLDGVLKGGSKGWVKDGHLPEKEEELKWEENRHAVLGELKESNVSERDWSTVLNATKRPRGGLLNSRSGDMGGTVSFAQGCLVAYLGKSHMGVS